MILFKARESLPSCFGMPAQLELSLCLWNGRRIVLHAGCEVFRARGIYYTMRRRKVAGMVTILCQRAAYLYCPVMTSALPHQERALSRARYQISSWGVFGGVDLRQG